MVGLFAAFCTTWAFLPQVIKILKTQETKAISLSMYSVLVTGILLWLVYGLMIKDIPLIVANGITFILSGVVLILKIRYK